METDFIGDFQGDIFGHPRYRLLLCHGRPEIFLGLLRPLDLGPEYTRALGYINHGGTLDTQAMLFANRCTWAHGLVALEELVDGLENTLTAAQRLAVKGRGDPYQIIAAPYS